MKTICVASFLLLTISAWSAESRYYDIAERLHKRLDETPHVEETVDSADHKVLVATAQEEEGEDMLVVDYDRSLTALYRASDDQCYLVGGVDAGVNFKEQAAHPYDVDDRLHYKVAEDIPVNDKSLIPEAMQDICADKEVKWLERDIDAVRQARRSKKQLRKNCCWFLCICRG